LRILIFIIRRTGEIQSTAPKLERRLKKIKYKEGVLLHFVPDDFLPCQPQNKF
jgi:hypothetical protein